MRFKRHESQIKTFIIWFINCKFEFSRNSYRSHDSPVAERARHALNSEATEPIYPNIQGDRSCNDAPKLRPILKRPSEVINCRARTPPPIFERVIERAPTPEQDIVQRVSKLKNILFYYTLYKNSLLVSGTNLATHILML